MKNKKNNKGFTLVELLVVIAIIGILAVVAVPALFKNIEKGKVADLEADISAIRSAALSVYADTSKLPVGQTIDGNYQKPGTGKVDNDTIDSELEGLSKPFGGKYTTDMGTGADHNKLILTVIPGSEKVISESVIKKLENDLGKDKVKGDKNDIKVELMSK